MGRKHNEMLDSSSSDKGKRRTGVRGQGTTEFKMGFNCIGFMFVYFERKGKYLK